MCPESFFLHLTWPDLEISNQNNTPILFNKDGTAYKTYGTSSNAIVFVHGVGMSGDIWEPQVKYFAKNYQIITYDFLGHGQTPLKIDAPKLDDYVEQLNNLLNSLSISKFMLIGHSMGATISIAYVLKYPHKILSLIALNIAFNRDKHTRENVLNRAKNVLKLKKILDIDQTIERWFKNKNSPKDLIKIDKVESILKNTSPKGYGEAYRIFALSDKVFINNLSEIQPPVLYLTGRKDPNSTTLMSEQMSQKTPGSSSISIRGEAHMMAYIAEDKVNPLIEQFFINSKINT